jgi:hypothetical protein
VTTPQMTLYETLSVTLDGSGNGTARLRPVGSREFWLPDAVAVSASTNVQEAACKIYAGAAAAQQYFVDGTLSGSTGDSTGKISGHVISRTRDPYIFCVWAGGDAGAVATAVVSGSKEIR